MKEETIDKSKRLTQQALLPRQRTTAADDNSTYELYPSHALARGHIFSGYASLVNWMLQYPVVLIDGYAGIFWEEIKEAIEKECSARNQPLHWINMQNFLKPEEELAQLVQPFLGEANAIWGRKTTLALQDFFDASRFPSIQPREDAAITLVLGVGAALLHAEAPLVYIDLPKNELQYRMRAGAIHNLGSKRIDKPEQQYKRFYFVDWVVLNQHKQQLLNRMDVVADAQWLNHLNWMFGTSLRDGLQQMSSTAFRARPWFEPGVWGGQWIKQHLPVAPAGNYAWSFELITPENGIVFESDGNLLEVSFDFLMYHAAPAILGKHAAQYGTEFPIRFDFLDTYHGGNLSVQCHPSLHYIREVFGETITQDETYYIVDCTDDAKVYLGFRENIDAAAFRAQLENSVRNGEPVEVEKYVQVHPAQKHDLFLIPNGTVHSAGANNLVLEISATPYIFTFKMYDWLRKNQEGQARPINIEHAFKNLRFERKGSKVKEELVCRPVVLATGADWQLVHLPTHAEHFYDIHRMEFDSSITIATNNSCHVLMLVEGETVQVQTSGTTALFHFVETFVVPAACTTYTLVNKGRGRAKVVKAFLKDGTQPHAYKTVQ